jgi:uncharacterized membrane-anchored protein YhcB (DUF1043 family)
MELCEFLGLLQISIVLLIGMFVGSLVMFIWDYKQNKRILNELYEAEQALDYYINKYEKDEE